MPKISALATLTSPDGADEAPVVDKSVTTTKKWTLTALKTWLMSLTLWITPSMVDFDSGASTVLTSQTTTSTSYVDLATVQSCAVTVGQSGDLLVGYGCQMSNSGANGSYAAVALSGANTYAATDNDLLLGIGTAQFGIGRTKLFKGLTPGATTVTMKFKVDGGTGTFLRRNLWATPL